MDDLERKFRILKEHFDRLDMEHIQRKGISVWQTDYGLFGTSDLYDVFELFKQVGLSDTERFVDLGSGDGRVALLASLFTDAAGIEGDETLHKHARTAREALRDRIPEVENCELVVGDYTEHDLSRYDTIFIYADHDWPDWFQEKLRKECSGVLYSLHDVYRPEQLPKGKTFWIGQVPFVSYPLNDDASS